MPALTSLNPGTISPLDSLEQHHSVAILTSALRFRWTKRILSIIVLVSVIFVAVDDPSAPMSSTIGQVRYGAEIAFLAAFIYEMIIKIIARGLIMHPGSYLRSFWNVLDLLLNILGVISLALHSQPLQDVRVVRAIRLLRVLRAAKITRALQTIVSSFFLSFRYLVDVGLVLVALFVFAALLGLHLWKGVLHQRCFDNATGAVILEGDRMCSLDSAGRACASGQTCTRNFTNPNDGFTSFDDFGFSILTLIAASSTDSWIYSMYYLQDASSPHVWLFWVSFIVASTYLAFNLVSAVVVSKFQEIRAQQMKEADSQPRPKRSFLGAFFGKTKLSQNCWQRVSRAGVQFARRRKTCFGLACQRFLKLHLIKFEIFILLILLINLVVLASEHFRMSVAWEMGSQILNIIFVFIYVVECGIRFCGGTAFPKWFVFDFVVALVSVIDIILYFSLGSVRTVLTQIRALRLLRLFRSLQIWHGVAAVIDIAVSAVKDIVYVTLVVFSIIFLFALIARDIMIHHFTWDGITSRWNFDTLWWSFVTSFQVFLADTWTTVMYNGMKANSWNSLWFVVLYLFGDRLLLNLFISVLLNKFSLQPDRLVMFADTGAVALLEPGSSLDRDEATEIYSTTASTENSVKSESWDATERQGADQAPPSDEFDVDLDFNTNQVEIIEQEDMKIAEKHIVLGDADLVISGSSVRVRKFEYEPTLREESLNYFSPESYVRRFSFSVVTNRFFEWAIAFIVAVNCVFLAMEPSTPTGSSLKVALFWIDVAFVLLYIIELLLKVVSFGLIQTKDAFLTKGWNVFDFLLVVINILGLVFPNVSYIKALRSLRVLRVICRIPRLNLTFQALFKSLPAVAHVFVLVAVMWLIWGILGVNFFGGLFYRCNDPAIQTRQECNGTFIPAGPSTQQSRIWQNPPFDFDSIGKSILSLFQIAGGVAAVDIMFVSVDVTAVDQQPVRDGKPENALFTILFIISGSFFAVNLFSSAVIDNFRRMRRRLEGWAFLTGPQQRWLNIQRILLKLKPLPLLDPPDSVVRVPFFKLAESKWLGYAVDFVTFFNLVVLAVSHEGESVAVTKLIDVTSWVTLSFHILECLIKLVGLGPTQYFAPVFQFTRYKFDFVVTAVSTIAVGASMGAASVFDRVMRVVRLVRLVRSVPRLGIVFQTFGLSLPSIIDIAVLIFCIYFVFALFGMHFFGSSPFFSRSGVNELANFSHFGLAMLSLFRISTKDGWPYLMADLILPPPCVPDYAAPDGSSNYQTCSHPEYAVFFVLFIFIMVYIMYNLFLAVLLDKFNELSRMSDLLQKWPHFSAFSKEWTRRDPRGTGRIPASEFIHFMIDLGVPLGFSTSLSRRQILRELQRMNLSITKSKKLVYEDVLRALATRAIVVDLSRLAIEDNTSNQYLEYTIAHYYATQMLIGGLRLALHRYRRLRPLTREKKRLVIRSESSLNRARAANVIEHLQAPLLKSPPSLTQIAAAPVTVSRLDPLSQLETPDSIAESLSRATKPPDLTLMRVLQLPELCRMFMIFDDMVEPTKMNTRFLLDALSWRGSKEHSLEEAQKIVDTFFRGKHVISMTKSQLHRIQGAIVDRIAETKHGQFVLPPELFDAAFRIIFKHVENVMWSSFLDWGEFKLFLREQATRLISLEVENEALKKRIRELENQVTPQPVEEKEKEQVKEKEKEKEPSDDG